MPINHNISEIRRLREKTQARGDQIPPLNRNQAVNDPVNDPTPPFTSTATPPPNEEPATGAADTPPPEQTVVEQLQAIDQETEPDQQSAAARQGRLLQEIERELPCSQNQFGGFDVLYAGGTKLETIPLNSERFADVVRFLAQQRGGPATHVPKERIETLRSILRYQALLRPPITVNRRVGKDGNDDLYDLGDGQIVRTNAQGSTLERNTRHPFRWSREQAVTPPPVLITDPRQAFICLESLLAGVPLADRIPLVAVVVEYLRSDTPHPILQLLGPEGSMKSSLAERIIRAVDNFGSDEPPSTGLEPADMVASAQAHHCLLIDNATHLPKGSEDLFCIAALGGAKTTRLLYTNAETHTAQLHNPIIITAIQSILRQSDALDRSYTINVQKPTVYRSMAEVRAEYAAKLPEIHGALLCLLSTALRLRPQVSQVPGISQHRMIDWMMTGEAIAQSLGQPPGRFVQLMSLKRRTAAKDYLEGDLFASALLRLLQHWVDQARQGNQLHPRLPSWRTWSTDPGWVVMQADQGLMVAATATAIHKHIRSHVDVGLVYDRRIPDTARATTGALQRVQGVLTRSGINCERSAVNGGNNGFWHFHLS